MITSDNSKSRSLLLMVAGAKGAVASTVAVAAAVLRKEPEAILPSLTTGHSFPYIGPPQAIYMTGWDNQPTELSGCVKAHGVLPENLWEPYRSDLDATTIFEAPLLDLDLSGQIGHLIKDIRTLKQQYPNSLPVLINLLPAGVQVDLERFESVAALCSEIAPRVFPDLAYALAAIFSKIPVVNFTPNQLEVSAIVREAVKQNVPISGCDGKTGQTYLKVVLASALKARKLNVDGWYSLNLLGNSDGKNLMDPRRAAEKLANKTELLDEILGYPVGKRYGEPCHKVHIDYYPPRGDAKEAWDVIDFQGMFGLPMSIRLNLQGRDSILAAPLILDLARWMAVLQMSGRCGPIPELGFYFKKPAGTNPPLSFEDQIYCLRKLEKECDQKCRKLRSEP
ncbi:MAG: inositol-3-phosphate synthase [Desulfobacterales bacterium]|uniref:Inositol-3-phosphate synthase n=1 Tax=Candidatus Desulfatibia profunda TaxID=2841695 RepID=A0A8J6TLS8_9BACT|nr:inositol-3-phosphate synthase [Candidatus Desulfatibia profunda]MBL7178902.1 inositol-3-phosphate synthase [Desulfobacterales bacterium]